MSHTITVRLTRELAEWLEMTAKKSGVPQGKIIRDQLERAKAALTFARQRTTDYLRDFPEDKYTHQPWPGRTYAPPFLAHG